MKESIDRSPMVRTLLAVVGAGIALVSAMFAVIFAVELAGGGDGKTQPGVLAGLVVFFIGTALAGGYLAWRMLWVSGTSSAGTTGQARPGMSDTRRGRAARAADDNSEAGRERRILQFAEKEHGRVTVAEVAAHCGMTVEQARADLDRLATQKVAELLVTESGVLVYVFHGFLSDGEKAEARDF